MKQPCVYILASAYRGTLYIGVSSNLLRRIWQHKNLSIEGFVERYRVKRLVYYEQYADMYSAISREKQLKRWRRAWKIQLVEENNPEWKDLWGDIAS